MKATALILVLLVLVSACQAVPLIPQIAQVTGGDSMSEEDMEFLRGELDLLRTEIGLAEEKDRLYSGGLVKALIASRIEILKTAEALILARLQAAEAGAKLVIEVRATEPDLDRAAQLEEEIALKQSELEEARQEAARFSGGLVQGLALATVATTEQTLAMLKQEYLIAQYGLGFPVVRSPSSEKPSIQALPQEPAEPVKTLELVDVDARVTESNNTWSRYAWKMTVRNLTARQIGFEATIEFQDGDGFVVDDAREYGLALGPHEENTFTGYTLIDASVAGNVAGVQAKIAKR